MAVVAPVLAALSLGLGLARQPYVGVACHGANSISCGRVGIAVWLARPHAVAIDATLEGRQVCLSPPTTPGGYWVGYVRVPLQRMGLPAFWTGTPSKQLKLVLRISYPSGRRSATLHVPLRPGWG